MITYKQVNKILNQYGYELAAGDGYIYFWPTQENNENDTPDKFYQLMLYSGSIAVCKLNHCGDTLQEALNFIIRELVYEIEYTLSHGYNNNEKIKRMKSVLNQIKTDYPTL